MVCNGKTNCPSEKGLFLQVIADTLHQLNDGGDSKAKGLPASIPKWDFIIAAVVLQHIFKYTGFFFLADDQQSLPPVYGSVTSKLKSFLLYNLYS